MCVCSVVQLCLNTLSSFWVIIQSSWSSEKVLFCPHKNTRLKLQFHFEQLSYDSSSCFFPPYQCPLPLSKATNISLRIQPNVDWVWRPMCCCCLVAKSCPTLLRPCGLWPAWLFCPWHFSGYAGVGCLSLLQGIFPMTQRLNRCLLHCWQILYCWATRENLEINYTCSTF